MRPLHWKRRLKYLRAVADHLVECGYSVNEPAHDDDYLDVWGKIGKQKCFVTIYVTMYEGDSGGR